MPSISFILFWWHSFPSFKDTNRYVQEALSNRWQKLRGRSKNLAGFHPEQKLLPEFCSRVCGKMSGSTTSWVASLYSPAVCSAPINSAVGTCGTKKGNPFEHIMKELLEISYQVHEWGTRLIWYYVLCLGWFVRSLAPRLRFVSDGRKLIKMNTYLLGWRRCVLFSRVSSKGLCDGRRAMAIRCLMSGKVERDNEWRNFSMVLWINGRRHDNIVELNVD